MKLNFIRSRLAAFIPLIKKHGLLICILVISLIARLFNLGHNPGQLNRDEAALAYNAFLLKESGRDEWGRAWPLALESFGDYKLPGYPIILIPFFGLLSLSDAVVRLPSVLAGVGLTLLTYLLARKTGVQKWPALLGTLVVGLSGPMYFFSRMAFEAMVALLCMVSALFLTLDAKPPTNKRFALIIVLVVIAALTYNTPLLYLPVLALSWLGRWGLKNARRVGVWSVVALVAFVIIYALLSPLIARKSGITLLADDYTRDQFLLYRAQHAAGWQRILASWPLYYGSRILQQYAAHFGPWFLVQRGGNHPWHSLPDHGHYEWFIYVSFLWGCVAVGRQFAGAAWRFITRAASTANATISSRAYLAFWLLFVPLPAALTVDAPHATRTLLFLLFVPLFAAYGWQQILDSFSQVPARRLLLTLATALVCVSIGWYQFQYHFVFPQQQASNFELGFKEVVQEAAARYPNEDIAVVDPGGYNYILTAWYLQLPAQTFLQTVVHQLPNRLGLRYGEQVGQFHFIAKEEDRLPTEKLLIHHPSEHSTQWVIEHL